jgi:hypothetical protein
VLGDLLSNLISKPITATNGDKNEKLPLDLSQYEPTGEHPWKKRHKHKHKDGHTRQLGINVVFDNKVDTGLYDVREADARTFTLHIAKNEPDGLQFFMIKRDDRALLRFAIQAMAGYLFKQDNYAERYSFLTDGYRDKDVAMRTHIAQWLGSENTMIT